jgi:K+ transporter
MSSGNTTKNAAASGTKTAKEHRRLAILSLKSLGIVFGDIRASPLYAVMARNEMRVTNYFNLPPSQVFEMGVQIEV